MNFETGLDDPHLAGYLRKQINVLNQESDTPFDGRLVMQYSVFWARAKARKRGDAPVQPSSGVAIIVVVM